MASASAAASGLRITTTPAAMFSAATTTPSQKKLVPRAWTACSRPTTPPISSSQPNSSIEVSVAKAV
ncbi:hypothetical protein SAMN04487981_11821 [Streptomyces sp. cf386]|nr:hypothetical protein SAMN04487981_11821 [Streptomyces sp. cf386]